MLVAILTKPWWKSLVKGGEEEGGSELAREQAALEAPAQATGDEQRRAPQPLATAQAGEESPPIEESSAQPATELEQVEQPDSQEKQEEQEAGTRPPREPRRGREGRREGRGEPRRRAEKRPVEDSAEDEGEDEGETHLADDSHHEEDPFAPAYDLEHGRPIQERNASGAALPWKSKIKTPKEFFAEELLYRFDILENQDRNELRGRYRIELKGYKGGIWTVDLGDELTVVNRREEAEIVLTMQQRDFIHLVNGEMNPQLLILAQKLKVQGDIRKAVKFENLLVPSSE